MSDGEGVFEGLDSAEREIMEQAIRDGRYQAGSIRPAHLEPVAKVTPPLKVGTETRDLRRAEHVGEVLLRPQIKQAARAHYGREPSLSEIYDYAFSRGYV